MYGFCESLRASEMYTPGVSSATGVSGGAINAVCLAAGISVAPGSTFRMAFLEALRRKANTSTAVYEALDAALPARFDAAAIAGRARIAVVEVEDARAPWRARAPIVVDAFESRTDLIEGVCASAHIPFLMK